MQTGSRWLTRAAHWQKLGPAESHTLLRKGRSAILKLFGSVIRGSSAECVRRALRGGRGWRRQEESPSLCGRRYCRHCSQPSSLPVWELMDWQGYLTLKEPWDKIRVSTCYRWFKKTHSQASGDTALVNVKLLRHFKLIPRQGFQSIKFYQIIWKLISFWNFEFSTANNFKSHH